MDGAMAPPLKRRKLSSSVSEEHYRLDNSTVTVDAAPSYSHSVESLSHTYSSLAPARTESRQDGQQIQKPAVGGIEHFKVLIARQGTGSSSSSVSSTSRDPSVTGSEYSSVTSMVSSSSQSLSTTASSPTLPADTVPAGVTASSDSSSNSSSDSPSSSSSSSSRSNETSSAQSSSPSNSSRTSSRVVSSSSNDTSSSTPSSRPSSTTTADLSTASQNLTTSGESSTTTLKTTIDLDSSSTRTSSSSSSIDPAFLFLYTLSNGDITTISRHSGAFTTTLRDGEVATVPSISATTTRERTSSSRSSTARETTSTASSSSDQSTITSTATIDVAGGAGQPNQTYASASSTTSAASGGGGNNSSPPAGTIAGGVVGGAAGLAVLVLIAMLFVRWYRRKGQQGHRALPAGSSSVASPDPAEQTDRSGPGMAERAGIMPFVPALFRHGNRSGEGSSERGFTRVSGRKLPSAFSEGMSSEGARSQPPPGMPLSNSPPDERNLSSTSFYRDSEGFYGGDGAGGRSSTSPTSPTSPSSSAPIRTSGPEMMTMSPGPQRQPQVHHGGPYITPTGSEQATPPPAAAAQFARSDTPSSLRNSRFTEDM